MSRSLSLTRLSMHLALRLGMLVLVLAIFAASIWWDNAENRGIAGRQPRSEIAWADVPRGGVNTYLLHAEVVTEAQRASGDNKVARTFQMIRAAGLHWVRVQFPWEDIEVCGKGDFVDCRSGSKGASTWTKYDYIVEQARANDLELIVRLDRPPDWARKQAIASAEVQAALKAGYQVTGPPDRFEDYADFVGAIAQHYRDDLRFYQIWNEPNLPGEWNYRRQDPAEMVRLLRLAGTAIRTNDPDAVILFPALSQTDGADGVATNDLEYLQGIYDAGGRDTFDIMSAQLYGLGQPPEEHRYIRPVVHDNLADQLLRPIETRTDVGRIVLLHEVMVRNGDTKKAVWISEIGWNSAPFEHPWGVSVSEQQKGQYLVGSMQRAQAEWPWVGAMCIWMFRWGGHEPDPRDPTPFFQLVDFDFQPLPAFQILADYLHASPAVPAAQPNSLASIAPVLVAAGVAATMAWSWPVLIAAMLALSTGGRRLARAGSRAAAPPVRMLISRLRRPVSTAQVALALVVGLVIFYRASAQVPITLLGAAIFLPAALLRPDLALLAIPMTVPLYLAPKGIWDARFGLSRPAGYFIPLHEFVLLATMLGAVVRLRPGRIDRAELRASLVGSWPILLFLATGTLGVLVADVARGPALREWRWRIVEPVLFYLLVRLYARTPVARQRLLWAWLLAGVAVALIGLLQLAGINLAPLISRQTCFSADVVVVGGVQRATSVYCHPNNLGLALGRVWPVLAAMAVAGLAGLRSRVAWRRPWRSPAIVATALCSIVLAGIAASFSKGAVMGAGAALVALGIVLHKRFLLALALAGVILIIMVALFTRIERLNPLGGSSGARIELWQSAAAMLREHPVFGVGLDQFYALRNQEGSRYIAPEATVTSERFASHPHNLVLDIWLRMGLIGLIAFAALILQFCRRAWSMRHEQRVLVAGLLAVLVAALVHGMVDNFYFVEDLAIVFWLHLALVDTLWVAAQRTPNAHGPPGAMWWSIWRYQLMDQHTPDELDEDLEDDDETEVEEDDAPLPAPAAGGVAETEEIGGLIFVSNPEYPYPFKVAQPPRFWMEEQTGVLADAVETYIAGERLSTAQLNALKVYLRQFVRRTPLTGDAKVHLLLQKLDRLRTTREIEDFADEIAEFGAEAF